ncbi:transcription factor mef2A isoform X2 [Puntigrus tetrazona]|uniref:transcription factor mef2A isoform X2 n=1 Tax=Puntigrus tetrazona TaxID=1606681 RepID=UPI001C8993BC|nr:transcription factor mef2A isoform X2 [Puntigrus tetrazona]
MNILLHRVVVFSLTSLPLAVVCLDPVPVQFVKTPVLVASGTDAVFTVQTVSDVSLVRWTDGSAATLAMWANGGPVVMPVPQYQGRISVTAAQLTITGSRLSDSGNYSVSVEPSSATGLGVNTRSVQLKVFDAVSGVRLSLPSLPLEGGNVSLSCSWSAGSEVSVVWGKGGAALSPDGRVAISAGSVLIRQARRDDAGEYTCTVSNPVSAQTAKANLSVYYGPDAPQLTKASSECVGGGDATVGQTVRLTCTSASLPPASFSWKLNDQPVTAGQSGSGALSVQIFSANQSGRYTCVAQNDVTGGTSQQQIDLAVVVDRRLRDTVELQKTNQNEGMTIANRAFANGNHPDLTLHNSLPQNFTAIPNNNNGNINTMSQNIPSNSNPLQHHNAHLNTDVFQHNFNTVPDNGHQNNSYPNNDPQRSFPQQVQHNPNILIQTGNSQPGALAPTVHVNLNTLPRNDQFNNSQPQTVHVNLNTYPPETNRVQQHAESALQGQRINSNHQNNFQTGLLSSDPLSLGNQPHALLNNASTNGSHQANGLIQTGYSHPTNQTNANRRTANSRSSAEERTRSSVPVQTDNQFGDSRTHVQQMPWDRLRGTPAYPNPGDYSSDSSGSSDWPRRDRPAQRSRETEPSGRFAQAAPSPQTRDLQRPTVLNHSQMHSNVQRQSIQQNLSTQPQVQSQMQTALPHTQTAQGQNPIPIGLPWGTAIPQMQTGTRPNQTLPQPSVPLTEAALRHHTTQTDNPFANRVQQTQAALQNPGPSQLVQQPNKVGQRPPTPPPVLGPDDFQKLRREHMPQPQTIQPVVVQRRHRSPHAHRQTRVLHTSPQRMPGVHPMHATMHAHPTHMRQVRRGRPRR